MSIRDSRLLAMLCMAGLLCSSACGNHDDNGIQADLISPTRLSFNGLAEPLSNTTAVFPHGVTLQPAIATPVIVTSAMCPTIPPLLIPLSVVIAAEGDGDVFLNEVRAQFVDRSGVARESLTLSRAELVDIFGTTRIFAQTVRLFPLTLPFGCTSNGFDTVLVTVFTSDIFGRERSRLLSIQIR